MDVSKGLPHRNSGKPPQAPQRGSLSLAHGTTDGMRSLGAIAVNAPCPVIQSIHYIVYIRHRRDTLQ